MFTREILSQDETRPGMKSSLSMVKSLLLFTRFCRDEISSQDELILVRNTGLRFHSGMTQRKKTYEHFIPGLHFAMSMLLLDFWRMCSIYFPTLTYLNVMKVKRNTCGLFIKSEARKIIYFLCKV